MRAGRHVEVQKYEHIPATRPFIFAGQGRQTQPTYMPYLAALIVVCISCHENEIRRFRHPIYWCCETTLTYDLSLAHPPFKPHKSSVNHPRLILKPFFVDGNHIQRKDCIRVRLSNDRLIPQLDTPGGRWGRLAGT